MKKTVFILAALFLVCIFKVDLTCASEGSFVYHTYAREGRGEAVIAETRIQLKELSDGQTSISRQKQGEEQCVTNETLILNRDYATESWQKACGEGTSFSSVRRGDTLTVTGRLKGQVIYKKIGLGSKVLYVYPKYSLSKFAMSGMPKMKFWTLRRDKMSKLPMRAVNKGTKTIVVNGKEVEAIMVYYSITGKLREKHYNHNYYYRKSDGVFLKKEEPKGKIEELVKEE